MPDRPNLLVIMSDQHAPDAIGGLGHPVVRTPSLDRLMSRGVTFTNAYCPYPMCTPSRAGFMTGLRTPQHGVWELGTPLDSGIPTWAHVLRAAGYRTSISGRMHFIGHDKLHGFERRVCPDVGEMLVPYTYGDWDRPQADDHVMLGAIRNAGPTPEPTGHERYDARVIGAAEAELERLVSDDSRPWALMVGSILPHFAYAVSQPYYDLYDGLDIPLPRRPPGEAAFEELIPAQMGDSRKWLGLTTDGATEEQVRMARRCYYEMISCLDELIGRLLACLDQLGAAEMTWVVYLSDHGDNMGEHGFWSKLNFFEDSVRTPFIVTPPPGSSVGERCAAPVSSLDWMPTVLELAEQGPWPEPLPGRSLLPLIVEPSETWPARTVVSDYACDGTRVPMRMVRHGRWKACFAPGFTPILFDLEDDPHEWHDLGGDFASRDVLADLERMAGADGWDPEELRSEILTHKRRLAFIRRAETVEGGK